MIYSHFSLTLLHLFLEDPLAYTYNLSDSSQAIRLQNPITFRSLDCYRRNWHDVISSIWNALPADLLLQGHAMGWRSVLKDLQYCCCY